MNGETVSQTETTADASFWRLEAERLADELAAEKAAHRLSEASSLAGGTRVADSDREALRTALRAVYGRMYRIEAELDHARYELGNLSYVLGDDA